MNFVFVIMKVHEIRKTILFILDFSIDLNFLNLSS